MDKLFCMGAFCGMHIGTKTILLNTKVVCNFQIGFKKTLQIDFGWPRNWFKPSKMPLFPFFTSSFPGWTFEHEDSAEDGSSLIALLPGEQGDAAPGESAPTTRT